MTLLGSEAVYSSLVGRACRASREVSSDVTDVAVGRFVAALGDVPSLAAFARRRTGRLRSYAGGRGVLEAEAAKALLFPDEFAEAAIGPAELDRASRKVSPCDLGRCSSDAAVVARSRLPQCLELDVLGVAGVAGESFAESLWRHVFGEVPDDKGLFPTNSPGVGFQRCLLLDGVDERRGSLRG